MIIYALSDPRTPDNVRYIGKATDIHNRLNRHLKETSITKKNNWIKMLSKENIIPLISIIDIVEDNEWQKFEIYWISQFKTWGFNLLNMTAGGDGVDKGNIPWNKGIKTGKPAHNKGIKTGKPAHNKGIKMPDESRKKMAEAKRNKPGSCKGKTSPFKGMVDRYSKETIKKMSDIKLGNTYGKKH